MPQFQRLNPNGSYVFAVDWQAPVLNPSIGWVQAKDRDEKPQLVYTIAKQSVDRLISINETSGALELARSLNNEPEDEFELEVTVSDGLHNVSVPVKLYKLQPGVKLVLVTVDRPVSTVDEMKVSRALTSALPGLDAFVLVKQMWIGHDGTADPKRAHLLVWAQDHETKVPVEADILKKFAFNPILYFISDYIFTILGSWTKESQQQRMTAAAIAVRLELLRQTSSSWLAFWFPSTTRPIRPCSTRSPGLISLSSLWPHLSSLWPAA